VEVVAEGGESMSAMNIGWLALNNRYMVIGDLISDGALHVGSGLTGEAEGDATDAGLLRDHRGLLIPGASLRGALRAMIERILQSVGGNRGCVLFAEGTHPTCLTAQKKEKQREKEKLAEKEFATYLLDTGLCDICKLFGSPWLASKLRVSDSRPPAGENPMTQMRHGVGIDRDTGTARDQIKFDFEVLEPEQKFSFQVEVENANGKDFALLGILLTQMRQQGIVLGGKKSRGLGRMKLELREVRYFDNSPASSYRLADFLLEGELGTQEVPDFNRMLEGEVLNYLAEGSDATAASE
jgi:CRISPR-associated RAMP protein (TIGR02581 family)